MFPLYSPPSITISDPIAESKTFINHQKLVFAVGAITFPPLRVNFTGDETVIIHCGTLFVIVFPFKSMVRFFDRDITVLRLISFVRTIVSPSLAESMASCKVKNPWFPIFASPATGA